MNPTHTKQKISFVMPAYNEEDRLPPTFEKIRSWYEANANKFEIELIIVDDGSKDGTAALVRSYAKEFDWCRLIQTQHVGMMNAIMTGYADARFPLIGTLEADCAAHPSEIERLLKYMPEHDVTVGSRIVRGDLPQIEGKSFFRRILSFGMSSLFVTLFRLDVRDPQIGFKIFKAEVLQKILSKMHLQHDGMKASELLVKAYGCDFKIKEVAIHYVHDNNSRCVPKNPTAVIIRALAGLIELWILSDQEYRHGELKRNPVRFSFLIPVLHPFLPRSVLPKLAKAESNK